MRTDDSKHFGFCNKFFHSLGSQFFVNFTSIHFAASDGPNLFAGNQLAKSFGVVVCAETI